MSLISDRHVLNFQLTKYFRGQIFGTNSKFQQFCPTEILSENVPCSDINVEKTSFSIHQSESFRILHPHCFDGVNTAPNIWLYRLRWFLRRFRLFPFLPVYGLEGKIKPFFPFPLYVIFFLFVASVIT